MVFDINFFKIFYIVNVSKLIYFFLYNLSIIFQTIYFWKLLRDIDPERYRIWPKLNLDIIIKHKKIWLSCFSSLNSSQSTLVKTWS